MNQRGYPFGSSHNDLNQLSGQQGPTPPRIEQQWDTDTFGLSGGSGPAPRTSGEIRVQEGGRTRARPHGLVGKGLLGCMSPRWKARAMGIILIPLRRLTTFFNRYLL